MWTKKELLNTKIFINNKYFNNYYNLLTNIIINPVEKINKHHIIPRSYYKHVGLKPDNSNKNIIALNYKDHILAHYYLCLCIKDKALKYKLVNALSHMLAIPKLKFNNINDDLIKILDLNKYQELHDSFCNYMSETCSSTNTIWCYNIITKEITKYNGFIDAAKKLNLKQKSLSNACHHQFNHHNLYIFNHKPTKKDIEHINNKKFIYREFYYCYDLFNYANYEFNNKGRLSNFINLKSNSLDRALLENHIVNHRYLLSYNKLNNDQIKNLLINNKHYQGSTIIDTKTNKTINFNLYADLADYFQDKTSNLTRCIRVGVLYKKQFKIIKNIIQFNQNNYIKIE